jgi:hypothetical protein
MKIGVRFTVNLVLLAIVIIALWYFFLRKR